MNNDTVKTKDFSYQEDPIPGRAYVLTWDPAKSPDFSVITVVDRDTGRVAVFDYGNMSEYRSQSIRVLSLASKYNNAPMMKSEH